MSRAIHTVDVITGSIAILALALIYAPLAVIGVFSFWQPVRAKGSLGLSSFSLDSYESLAHNQEILSAVGVTLSVGGIATLLGLVLATGFAFYFQRTRGWPRQVMQLLIFLPFLLPPIITGLALLISFREMDLTRGFWTIVAGHTLLVVPVVYRTVLVRLNALNASLAEASLDLGASQLQTFQHILFPQLRVALASAALLAFAISFDETMVTLFLSGSTSTLPIRLWAMMRLGFVPEINALAMLIVLLAIAATIAFTSLQLIRNHTGKTRNDLGHNPAKGLIAIRHADDR